MDVDKDFSAHRVNLIRAVRTIDEDTSVTLPDKVHKLWLLLAASKSSRLHGVEETILRWLCKHMAGTNDDAELARRYPLSWEVLSRAFQKIPPQALGKSLADRKFITILRKTLDDVSRPSDDSEMKSEDGSNKRKRASVMPDNLAGLRSRDGCIRSSASIFVALSTLLGYESRVDGLTSPQDRVGVEHIKSLFSSSSEETRDITACLLRCCRNAVWKSDESLTKEKETWVGISTAVWDLRLHSKDDTFEFARHLYPPTCFTLGVLRSRVSHTTTELRWMRQLERLLGTSFIRPARHIFAQTNSVQNLESALELTNGDPITSTQVLWHAASRMPRDQSNPVSKTGHASWAKAVFSAILKALEAVSQESQNRALVNLLATAIETRSTPDTDFLRDLTKSNALLPGHTDWELIGQVIACDADVFLVDQNVRDMLLAAATTEGCGQEADKDLIVGNVLIPLMEASARARDLSGFIRQWYDGLCKVTESQEKKLWSSSVWVDARLRQQLADLLQPSLSISQVLRLFEFLDTPNVNQVAALVILEGLCAGITYEDYQAALDPQLFSAAFQDKKYKKIPSEIAALRWRIAGYMVAWEKSEDVSRLWEEVKSGLKKALKSGGLADTDTFEAFRCCHQIWLANHFGGRHEADAAKLVSLFLARLLPELTTLETSSLHDQYLEVMFGNLPRLVELGDAVSPELLETLKAAFLQVCRSSLDANSASPKLLAQIQTFLGSDAEDQEALMDALLGEILDLVDGSSGEAVDSKSWSLPAILILEQFPTETWTRTRRKRLLASWKKSQSATAARALADATYSTAVLRLLVKVLQQPTFYEGMDFQDLLLVASMPVNGQSTISALASRVTDMIIRHVVESTEQTSIDYLKPAFAWVDELDVKHPATRDFYILKSLSSALRSGYSKPRLTATNDLEKVKQKLRDIVRYSLADISKRAGSTSESQDGQLSLVPDDQNLLRLVLEAADAIPVSVEPLKLPKDAVLESLSLGLARSDINLAWTLRKFLLKNNPDMCDNAAIVDQLVEASGAEIKAAIDNFTASFMEMRAPKDQADLISLCLSRCRSALSAGSLLVVQYILKHVPALHGITAAEERTFDAPQIFKNATLLLPQTTSLEHFKLVAEILITLLDRHSGAMTQFSIESALNVVAEVASLNGPHIHSEKAEGEVFEGLYKLVATVIRRHRRRLDGHFPVLVATLQSLLRVVLADPLARITTSSPLTMSSTSSPPWLASRLRARHAARFARLLTLVCEPSAAAVARSRGSVGAASATTTLLDSATDAAKRIAGQDMFHVVELYVKLQLEVTVPQDMRKALEPGIYSVLNITPEGCRRVMNESLDVNGRAVFRELFAAYKKFGRWSGV